MASNRRLCEADVVYRTAPIFSLLKFTGERYHHSIYNFIYNNLQISERASQQQSL